MTPPTCSADLVWRGLVHQVTDAAVLPALDARSLTAYIGFDPTADSLHLGNLLMLCTLRRLQQGGHRVLALAGGGTGMIGDPGGRSDERNLLTREVLGENLAAIRLQLERFIELDDTHGKVVDNADWLWQIPLLEFLRDTGKHFTINQMIKKEMVRERIEDESRSISYTEFSYMLLQAHDFLELHRREGCTLQLGGSDQWGNIAMGVELIRKVEGGQAYGITSPLVTKADGTKFGKSVGGAVWLDAAKTSPYAMWQFLLNAEDVKVGAYLRAFTWLDKEEIEALDRLTEEAPGRRAAGRALADAVVGLVHGPAEAAAAARAAEVLFTPDIASLDEAMLVTVLGDAPSAPLPPGGTSLVDALVAVGLVDSRGAARRLVEQGGVSVNGVKADAGDAERVLTSADALHGRVVVLRKGKRDQAVLVAG